MTFRSPLFSQDGTIAVDSIHSLLYQMGITGWSLNKDGTAEFNNLGGSFQITGSGIFFYIPNAGSGNLRMALSNADGTDPYGNTYKAGLFLNQKQAWFAGDNSHTVVINPTGQTGAQINFTPAGFNPLMRMLVEGPANRLLIEPLSGSNAVTEINGPVIATAGFEGSYTAQAVAPPLNVVGTFTEYLSASWSPVTIKCPPAETVHVNMLLRGIPSGSASGTVAIGFNVKIGGTTLFTPVTSGNTTQNGPIVSNDGINVRTTPDIATLDMVVGNSILAGKNGQTLTFTPMWRSGGAGCSISFGSMRVTPQLFRTQQSSVA